MSLVLLFSDYQSNGEHFASLVTSWQSIETLIRPAAQTAHQNCTLLRCCSLDSLQELRERFHCAVRNFQKLSSPEVELLGWIGPKSSCLEDCFAYALDPGRVSWPLVWCCQHRDCFGSLGVLQRERLISMAWDSNWNIVMASCFASPLLMVACCWRHPWLLLPTLGYVLWSRLNRVELKDGAAWPWFSKQEWGYHVPWLNTFSLNSLRCEAFRRYLQLRIHVHPELQERPPESLGYQRFKIFKYI